MLSLLKDIFPYAIVLFIIFIVVYILLLPFIASWKLFKKVGIPGYKSLIPIYNEYLILKIAGMNGLWLIVAYSPFIIDSINNNFKDKLPDYVYIILIVFTILAIIFNIIRSIKLSKAFDRGILFMIGMFFFPTIFEIILGMGRSQYIGNYNKK